MKYQCESVPAILQLGRNIVNNVFLCYITSHSHYLNLKYVRDTGNLCFGNAINSWDGFILGRLQPKIAY